MACSQTLNGYTALDCAPSKGGVKEIYICNFDDVTGITASTAETISESGATTDGKVIAIAMASGATWHKYVMRRNTASMTSTLNFDETVGVNYVSTDVILRFNKLDTPQRIEMTALVLAETRVVVRDANDKWWLLGKDEPIVPSAGTAQTGTQKSDGSYYELTLQSSDNTWPLELSDEAIATVKGA